MPNPVQIYRSLTTTNRPAGRAPGEPWVNFPDLQFGVFNAAPTPLIAVRFWVATATYAAGDCVLQGGQIWVANGAIPPGPFVAAQWTQISGASGAGVYLPLVGGTMTGPIVLPAALATGQQAVPFSQLTTELGLYLPKSAGAGQALTGPLHLLAAAPTLGPQATNKTYVDAADALLAADIALLAGNLLFSGILNATTGFANFTVASGLTDGPLPAAAPGNANRYLIIEVAGPGGTPPALPVAPWAVGDWAVSDGTTWVRIPTGQAAVTAPQVAMAPPVGLMGGNVQVSIEWIDANKVDLAGDTMTGPLTLPAYPGTAATGSQAVPFAQLADITIDAGTF